MQSAFGNTPKLFAIGSAIVGSSLFAARHYHYTTHQTQLRDKLKMTNVVDLPPWKATFAVPMSCQSCVDEIEATLRPLEGVKSLDTSLVNQTITVDSSLPPSTIQRALAAINRDAILRGSGLPNSAAVAIVETYSSLLPQGKSPVRGLVRMVQVREGLILCDVGVSNLGLESGPDSVKGTWSVSIRKSGDLSRGPQSTGGIWSGDSDPSTISTDGIEQRRGFLGSLEVDETGKGAAVLVKENVSLWELIGRGLVIERMKSADEDLAGAGTSDEPESHAVVGVIARSAGVWDNDKTVCSCSGKTVWEEREEQRGRGML